MEGAQSCSWCSGAVVGLAALAVYMAIIRMLRFRRVGGMKLSDVERDAAAVYRKTALLEFPFTVEKAIDFSFFRAFGVPSISGLVHQTRQFALHAGKRYDDTDLLIKEYNENGPQTDRAITAMARINAIHGKYSSEISNADMLYAMSLFVTDPMNWIDRFEWRKSTEVEKAAFLAHFQEMGERMGIKGVREWKTWDDAYAHQLVYEAEHFGFQDCNILLVDDMMKLFLSGVPSYMRPFGRSAVSVLMDPPLLKAVGLPEAPLRMKWFVNGALFMRAMTLRFLVPPRFTPRRRTSASDAGTPRCCPAASSPAAASDAAVVPGDADILRKPLFNTYKDTKLGCLFYKDGYQIKNVGTRSCPAGRLMQHAVPTFTGEGGGGSATNVVKKTTAVAITTEGKLVDTRKMS